MVGQDGVDTSTDPPPQTSPSSSESPQTLPLSTESLASVTTDGQDHDDALAEPPLPASLPSVGLQSSLSFLCLENGAVVKFIM